MEEFAKFVLEMFVICYIYIDDVRCDYGIVCADCVNDIDCSDEVIEEAIRENEDYI